MLKGSDASFGFWRPKRQQFLEGDAELLLGIAAEVLLHQCRSETVKTGGHRVWVVKRFPARVTASATSKGWPSPHEAARALQHRECGVASLRWQTSGLMPERAQQPPAADAEHHFLLQPQLRPAAVQLAGDAAMSGEVRRVIAVQQVSFTRPTWTCQARSHTE